MFRPMQAPSVTIPLASDLSAPAWRRLALPLGSALVIAVSISAAVGLRAGLVTGAITSAGLLALFRFFDGSRRLTFVVGQGQLAVRGDPFFSDTFSLSELEIEQSEVLDLTQKGPRALAWRTLGTGMPGYYSGEYSLKNGENAVVFMSDKRRVLYLPRRGGAPSLLLSVPDPVAFRELLLAARGR